MFCNPNEPDDPDERIIQGSVIVRSNGWLEIDMQADTWDATWALKVFPDYYLFGLEGSPSFVKAHDVIDARVEATTLLREAPMIALTEDDIDMVKEMIDEAWEEPCIVYRQLQEVIANAK